MKKDWSERFERAQHKPRHWRVVVGIILVAFEGWKFIMPPDSNEIQPADAAGMAGMYTARIAIVVLGAWLIYSGFKPKKLSSPK